MAEIIQINDAVASAFDQQDFCGITGEWPGLQRRVKDLLWRHSEQQESDDFPLGLSKERYGQVQTLLTPGQKIEAAETRPATSGHLFALAASLVRHIEVGRGGHQNTAAPVDDGGGG